MYFKIYYIQKSKSMKFFNFLDEMDWLRTPANYCNWEYMEPAND